MRIPVAFLSQAATILTSSEHGMSGSRIVEFCNAWATDHGVDTPHASIPWEARNKRTALLENLQAFPPAIQYQMLLDLCDLAGPERTEVQRLRTMLVERFGNFFPRRGISDPRDDAAVLHLLGVHGAGAYRPPPRPDVNLGPVVFICHASEHKPAARRFHALLKADGFRPWLDEVDLLPGQDWALEIPRAVKRADAVLVLLSANTIAKTGYVQREIRIALDAAEERPEGSVYIIPARLEDCSVPERLAKLQWVDAFADDGYKRICLALETIEQRGS
jgi:hypothetical protein